MEETKTATYYTPTLEELYGVSEIYIKAFGDYEYRKKEINPLKLKDWLTAVLDHEGKETETWLVPDRVKLKWLDAHDIQSLTFAEKNFEKHGNMTLAPILTTGDTTHVKKLFTFKEGNHQVELTGWLTPEMPIIQVYWNKEKVYSGLCKNLNELRKILNKTLLKEW